MRRVFALLCFVAFSCTLDPAWAGDPLNSQPNIRLAEFLAAPAAVTVDVVDLSTGSQVADDVAATQVQRDLSDTIAWKYDLATVTGYPSGCEAKTYLVTFTPDAADCSEGATPELCASEIVHVGGAACLASEDRISADPEFASTVISAQGITQSVLDFFERRGELVPKWRKLTIAADEDYATPETTLWEVYFWTDTNASPRIKCSVTTSSDPAVSLPSSSHCASG